MTATRWVLLIAGGLGVAGGLVSTVALVRGYRREQSAGVETDRGELARGAALAVASTALGGHAAVAALRAKDEAS